MTYEEAKETIRPGRYRHFKGREYEVLCIARHSEDESPMVVYRPLYNDSGLCGTKPWSGTEGPIPASCGWRSRTDLLPGRRTK